MRHTAEVVGRSEAAARQLAVRARRQVEEARPRFRTSQKQGDRLARGFLAATGQGDVAGLERLLAADVELHGDGGGKVPALARPLHGRVRVARTLAAWGRIGAKLEATFEQAEVNGRPGALVRDPDGHVFSVISLEVDGDVIRAINSVVNPDKLRHLGPVGDFAKLLRTR